MREIVALGEFDFIDILHRRYSDPFALLNQMVRAGCLTWFVRSLIEKHADDENDRMLWGMYLHKVFDGRSFEEYKEQVMKRVKAQQEQERLLHDPQAIASTVVKSKRIMDMMNRNMKGGE